MSPPLVVFTVPVRSSRCGVKSKPRLWWNRMPNEISVSPSSFRGSPSVSDMVSQLLYKRKLSCSRKSSKEHPTQRVGRWKTRDT